MSIIYHTSGRQQNGSGILPLIQDFLQNTSDRRDCSGQQICSNPSDLWGMLFHPEEQFYLFYDGCLPWAQQKSAPVYTDDAALGIAPLYRSFPRFFQDT